MSAFEMPEVHYGELWKDSIDNEIVMILGLLGEGQVSVHVVRLGVDLPGQLNVLVTTRTFATNTWSRVDPK